MVAATQAQAQTPQQAALEFLSVIYENPKEAPAGHKLALEKIFSTHPPAHTDDQAQALSDEISKFFRANFETDKLKFARQYEALEDTLVDVAQAINGGSELQREIFGLHAQAREQFMFYALDVFDQIQKRDVTKDRQFLLEAFDDALLRSGDDRKKLLSQTLNVIAYPEVAAPAGIVDYGVDLLRALDSLQLSSPHAISDNLTHAEWGAPSPQPDKKGVDFGAMQQRAQALLQRVAPYKEQCVTAAALLQEKLNMLSDKGKENVKKGVAAAQEHWQGLSEQGRRKFIQGAAVISLVTGHIDAPKVVTAPVMGGNDCNTEVFTDVTKADDSKTYDEKKAAEKKAAKKEARAERQAKAKVTESFAEVEKDENGAIIIDTGLDQTHQRTVKETLEDAEKLSTDYVPGDVSNKNTKKFYAVLADFIESSEGFMPKLTRVGKTEEIDVGFGHNCSLKNQKQFFRKVFGSDEVLTRLRKGGSISRAEAKAIFAEDIKGFDKTMQKQLNAHEEGLYDKLPMNVRVGLLSAYYNLSLMVNNKDMLKALSEGAKSGNYEEAGQLLANTTYCYSSGEFTINHGYGNDVSKKEYKAVDVAWDKYPGHPFRRLKEGAMVAGDHEFQAKGMNAARQLVGEIKALPGIKVNLKSLADGKDISSDMIKISTGGMTWEDIQKSRKNNAERAR